MTILLLGATGLVGGECLKLLAADPACEKIIVLTRGAFSMMSPKVHLFQVDYDKPETFQHHLKCDAVICALGSTVAKTPDYAAYRKIDVELPVLVGRMAREQGAQQFILVTAAGAKPGAFNTYLAMKGDAEEAVKALVFPCTVLVRPSLILGPRKEFRLKEYLSQKVLGPLRFLFPKRIRPVTATAIAQAIVAALQKPQPGATVISNQAIAEMSSA